MIQEVNWNCFKAKFNRREQVAFEQFCYLLFCKEFNHRTGIFRFKNHAGIETNPIRKDRAVIGWQAKFYDTRLSEHKDDFIKSISTTKTNHPDVSKIIFYTNQEFGQHKEKTNPKYKTEIENYAAAKGVEIEWRTSSFFESPFVSEDNFEIAQHFFSFDKENINVFVFGPLVKEEIIDLLAVDCDWTKDFIRIFLGQNANGSKHIQSLDQNLLLLEALKSSSLGLSEEIIKKKYDILIHKNKMELTNENIQFKIFDAATHLTNLEFMKAHQLLDETLKKISPDNKLYNFVYKEYLITGFICYSKENNITGLRSLLSKKAEIKNAKDLESDYIISLIFQEIFTRDIDLQSLLEVISSIENIYKEASDIIKPAMSNSLGLAYRRLGERKGISYLKKAISIFKDGLKIKTDNKKIEIELKDQMAIAHIRIFEFNKQEAELNKAEELLNQCLSLLDHHMDPRDYQLKPRILNNMGNIYKQRTLVFNDPKSAAKAIGIYEEALHYWNKKDAKYEWALLRKNIAETKYALGKLTNDVKILLEALNESIESTQYRNLKNSPYQWGKTVKIVFSLVILFDQLNSLKSLSDRTRRKILSYINIVIKDQATWSENISSQFVQSAMQAKAILT